MLRSPVVSNRLVGDPSSGPSASYTSLSFTFFNRSGCAPVPVHAVHGGHAGAERSTARQAHIIEISVCVCDVAILWSPSGTARWWWR